MEKRYEGFVQVTVAGLGSFITKEATIADGMIELKGPAVITLQVLPDPKNKDQMVTKWAKDRVITRSFPIGKLLSVDVLNPADLRKADKEIYENLTGIEIV